LSNKSNVKSFLIDEIGEILDLLNDVKGNIDDYAMDNDSEKKHRLTVNSKISTDISMRTQSLCEQLETAFKAKSTNTREAIKTAYNNYWQEVTSGNFMSDQFVFDTDFKNLHNKSYARFCATLKKTIYEINQY
jgi:hypothetical protein